jgi:ankyrin repeat protein
MIKPEKFAALLKAISYYGIAEVKAALEAIKGIEPSEEQANEVLFNAVGRAEELRLVYAAGFRPHIKPGVKNSPLHEAAEHGTLEQLTLLLGPENKGLNCEDEWGETLLYRALHGHCNDNVELLLKRGAKPNVTATAHDLKYMTDTNATPLLLELVTPLHQAAIGRNIKAMEMLIQAGANTDARDGDGKTPLDYITTPKLREKYTEMALSKQQGGDCGEGSWTEVTKRRAGKTRSK